MLNGTNFIAGAFFIMSLAFSFYICFSFMAVTPIHANQSSSTSAAGYEYMENFDTAPFNKNKICADESAMTQIPYSGAINFDHNFHNAIFRVPSL